MPGQSQGQGKFRRRAQLVRGGVRVVQALYANRDYTGAKLSADDANSILGAGRPLLTKV